MMIQSPNSLPKYNAPAMHESFKDVSDLRAFVTRLIALWDRDQSKPFDLKSEFSRGSGPLIWSYTNHAVELMRTIIDLSAKDRMIVAIPLIRLVLENAMTSVWLYLSPDVAASVVHEGLRTRRATFRDVIESGANGFDQTMLDAIDAELDEFSDRALPAGRHFEQRCRQIVDGLGVYASWRIMSSYSHAGMQMADFYLRETSRTETNPLGIVFEPKAQLESHEAWLGTATCMLLTAMKVCDLVDRKGRHKSQLESARKRMGISLEFLRAEPT